MSTARSIVIWTVLMAASPYAIVVRAEDPLPSWNDTPTRSAITDFIATVTREGSPDFVPHAERVAVFDNDGTLWVEQPMYVQLAFASDRVEVLAPQHPQWRTLQPYRAVLDGDMDALAAGGMEGIMKLLMGTHAGMTTDTFEALVTGWFATAQNPVLRRPHTELVYQPMIELIAYLDANGFSTWIVSGGGVEFMRPWTERVYGIPPERVVGSIIQVEYVVRDGEPALLRLPEIAFIDDKAGKPVGIHRHIGRRPIAAFGNSDGDLEMLEWTTVTQGRRLGVLVHHDDGVREFAYDRKSHFGKLDRGLDEAPKRQWIILSMKNDWNRMFPNP